MCTYITKTSQVGSSTVSRPAASTSSVPHQSTEPPTTPSSRVLSSSVVRRRSQPSMSLLTMRATLSPSSTTQRLRTRHSSRTNGPGTNQSPLRARNIHGLMERSSSRRVYERRRKGKMSDAMMSGLDDFWTEMMCL